MRKVLADMHVPPKAKQWAVRLGLVAVVLVLIGYVPSQFLSRDPKAAKLAVQLDALEVEATRLRTDNLAKRAQVEALRTDIGAIEGRARHELGMVYPDEIVIRIVEPSR
ncbi:MAG: septum formation initiator family protein [Kofleriaceae bacterium]|nr:septum formation initiator family protein [Kofleriaceae bacterium]